VVSAAADHIRHADRRHVGRADPVLRDRTRTESPVHGVPRRVVLRRRIGEATHLDIGLLIADVVAGNQAPQVIEHGGAVGLFGARGVSLGQEAQDRVEI
jgi:hypothetical protein